MKKIKRKKKSNWLANTDIGFEYDPNQTLGVDWSAQDRGHQLLAIKKYHLTSGESVGKDPVQHFILHFFVETQIACGDPATIYALESLIQNGVRRHDAIHKIGEMMLAANDRSA